MRNAARILFLVLVASLVGWAVPMTTRFVSERFYSTRGTAAILASMRAEVFEGGLFLVGLLNAVPFALAVALAMGTTVIVPRLGRQMKWMAYLLLVCAAGVTAASSLAVWNDLYGPGRAHSTACLALIVFPGYATVGVLTVYLVTLGAVAVASLVRQA